MTEHYPKSWPKPNPRKPDVLQTRITEEQKRDLYSRRVTTRDLAKALNVHEKHLSYAFPGKEPIVDKRPLIEARKEFKLSVAKEILEGLISIENASLKCYVSYTTMLRYLNKAKLKYPELLPIYEKSLLIQRQLSLKYARKAKNI